MTRPSTQATRNDDDRLGFCQAKAETQISGNRCLARFRCPHRWRKFEYARPAPIEAHR